MAVRDKVEIVKTGIKRKQAAGPHRYWSSVTAVSILLPMKSAWIGILWQVMIG